MNLNEQTLPIESLVLDPNNYRFHDLETYRPVPSSARYAEPGVQSRTRELLLSTEAFELESLKDSLRTNGYVPLEQIVVEEFDRQGEVRRYLVIEGNRRVAAIQSLLEEHRGGAIDIPADKLASLQSLPAIELVGSAEERADFKQTLMAIRHVAGIRAWGPYQQAKLIAQLYEEEEHQFSRVSQRIGLSSREVARRYRASRALQQMEEDDEFGDSASPRLYSFFHEAMSQPKVREWLGFSDETFLVENDETKRSFYELLSPRIIDGQPMPPKLQNATRQVRQLKDIVDKPRALRILLDHEKPFEEAVEAAEEDSLADQAGALEHALTQALRSLREPGIDLWLNPTQREREIWTDLVRLIDRIRPLLEPR